MEMNNLQLYRTLLRALKRYPSIKRDTLLQECRDDFRRNAKLTDERAIMEKRSYALSCLRTVQKYVGMDPRSSDWSMAVEHYDSRGGAALSIKGEVREKQPRP
eukprot:tig00021489_g21669.t1